ncbi:Alpha/Beta hydrolase protein [Entophlyctis helioformis]|nr:Alpha/Beta hydrolase protein [Entophlyctis helioformis]
MGGSIQCPPMPPATEPPEITLMQLATDVFDVLLALSWTQPALLGLGAGGMVAQYLALLLRGRDDVALAGLVLAGSAPMTPSRGSRLARAALELAQDRPAGSSVGSAGMGAGVAATQDADPVRAWIAANLTEPFCKQNPQRVAAIAGSWGSTSRSKLIGAEQVFAMDGVNLTDQLGLLAVPTLVIHGESDAMIDSSYGVMLSETIRNAHLAFIPKAGHWYLATESWCRGWIYG